MYMYIPAGASGKENPPASAGDTRDAGWIPGSERSPGEGNGNPLIFLPGKYHRQRRLEGYSPWSCIELDRTE